MANKYDKIADLYREDDADGAGGIWGSITGTLSDQTDLQTELDTKEDVVNKDTSVALGTSDTKYPSQKAVKTYVDAKRQGHTVKNAGTDLTQRTSLNFLAPLVATDDAAGDETEISLDLDAYITTEEKGITFDGQGGVIATGLSKSSLVIPFTGTITAWTFLADQSGSITVDSWKDTYANYPPTIADTMWGTKPNITASNKGQTTGLSIAVTAGDIIKFNVDSCSTITGATLSFTILKS